MNKQSFKVSMAFEKSKAVFHCLGKYSLSKQEFIICNKKERLKGSIISKIWRNIPATSAQFDLVFLIISSRLFNINGNKPNKQEKINKTFYSERKNLSSIKNTIYYL